MSRIEEADGREEPFAVAAHWRGLCRMGGVAALANAVLLIGEVLVYSVLPRSLTVREHLTLFHDRPLAGLLTLDLLGMLAYLLFIPTILAFCLLVWRASAALSIVGTALFFVGIATFFASSTAFPLLALGQQHAAATTEAERVMLLAAAQAMLALFNETAFLVSYVIVSAGWTMIAVGMLRSELFGRMAPWAGILAGAAGITAVVLEHTAQSLVPVAIGFYFAALIFLFLWVVLAGRRLLRWPKALARPMAALPVHGQPT